MICPFGDHNVILNAKVIKTYREWNIKNRRSQASPQGVSGNPNMTPWFFSMHTVVRHRQDQSDTAIESIHVLLFYNMVNELHLYINQTQNGVCAGEKSCGGYVRFYTALMNI